MVNLIEVYLHQVYNDGFFHADFHPGNLFTNEYGELTVIDFGIVGFISYHERLIIAKMLNGFLKKDYKAVTQAHIEGGYIKGDINITEFEKNLEEIGEKFIYEKNSSFAISGILMELFRVMEVYKIEVKEDLLLLYKTIFFVEAVIMKIDPSYNIWLTIKPWMNKWKVKNTNKMQVIFGLLKKILHIA